MPFLMEDAPPIYRGRIAPTPTGHLHLGHARTFWKAQQRAMAQRGILILRMEDLDGPRCKPAFVRACYEDLSWFGFRWQEGPDVGGPHTPYLQSTSTSLYQATMTQLKAKGCLYPCTCSRKDIQQTQRAPHAADDEWLYPGTCRPSDSASIREITDQPHCWRFKVPKGEHIAFEDGRLGPLSYEAGRDFGDFVIWRSDGVPSYQLAVTVDDHRMQVSEVIRGEDLLVSTARQLLIYRALGWQAPDFYHCPLVCDAHGQRLAKRDASLSLRTLRQQGSQPEALRDAWAD